MGAYEVRHEFPGQPRTPSATSIQLGSARTPHLPSPSNRGHTTAEIPGLGIRCRRRNATSSQGVGIGQTGETSMTRFRIVPLSEVPTPMICDEKGRLLMQYDDATLAFSNAVRRC